MASELGDDPQRAVAIDLGPGVLDLLRHLALLACGQLDLVAELQCGSLHLPLLTGMEEGQTHGELHAVGGESVSVAAGLCAGAFAHLHCYRQTPCAYAAWLARRAHRSLQLQRSERMQVELCLQTSHHHSMGDLTKLRYLADAEEY